MMARKDIGQAPAVDDLTASMASRYDTASSPAHERSAKTRRSWLLPTDVADALAAAAERIHYDSRGRISKSDAQAAIIRAGLARADDVAHELGTADEPEQQ